MQLVVLDFSIRSLKIAFFDTLIINRTKYTEQLKNLLQYVQYRNFYHLLTNQDFSKFPQKTAFF